MGLESNEDSGVYQLSPETALVQTIDFFTPVVDDPYDYGQIAVANSLSDIYAMGATPLTALNIVGFPIASMDKNILAKILKGGWEKAREADVLIIGGHSVKDPEIKYGLAVTAIAHPEKIIRNNTARIGDQIILTKPLGTGILTTALKNEKLPLELLDRVTSSMKRLNKNAAEIMIRYDVSACTDVTGFGLLGHLLEMVRDTGLSAGITARTIPLLPEVLNFIRDKQVPGGLKENLAYLKPYIHSSENLSFEMFQALCDPQTSGGLLFTVSGETAKKCVKDLIEAGDTEAAIIGKMITKEKKEIIVT